MSRKYQLGVDARLMVGNMVDGFRKVGAESTKAGRKISEANDKAGFSFKKLMAAQFAMTYGIEVARKVIDAGIETLKERQKTEAITAQLIKTTGGAAHVTSKQVEEYSTAMMLQTGISRGSIQSSQNLLLSFKGVHNELGKGNNVFNRATKAAMDMFTVIHGTGGSDVSLNGTMLKLGKALQDPVKGLTALGRVGISFTDTQKKMIKNWVDHGKTLLAQKFLLTQIEGKYGNAAKAVGQTFAGQVLILRQRFNEFSADLMAKSEPALAAVFMWFGRATSAGGVLRPIIDGLVNVWHGLVGGIQDAVTAFESSLNPAMKNSGSAAKDLSKWIGGNLTFFGELLRKVLPKLGEAFGKLTSFVEKHKRIIKDLAIAYAVLKYYMIIVEAKNALLLLSMTKLKVAFTEFKALLSPLIFLIRFVATSLTVAAEVIAGIVGWPVLIAAAVVAAGVAVVVAFKKVKWFHDGLISIWNWIKGVWSSLSHDLSNPIGQAFAVVKAALIVLRGVFRAAFGVISAIAGSVADTFKATWGPALDVFTAGWNTAKSAINAVRDALSTVIDLAGKAASAVADVLSSGTHAPDVSGGPKAQPHTPAVAHSGTTNLAHPTGAAFRVIQMLGAVRTVQSVRRGLNRGSSIGMDIRQFEGGSTPEYGAAQSNQLDSLNNQQMNIQNAIKAARYAKGEKDSAWSKTLQAAQNVINKFVSSLNGTAKSMVNMNAEVQGLGKKLESVKSITAGLAALQTKLQTLGATNLTGTAALDQSTFDRQQTMNQNNLALLDLSEALKTASTTPSGVQSFYGAGGTSGTVSNGSDAAAIQAKIDAITKDNEKLQYEIDRMNLNDQINNDPARRAINAALNPQNPEMSAGAILQQINDSNQSAQKLALSVGDLNDAQRQQIQSTTDLSQILQVIQPIEQSLTQDYDSKKSALDALITSYNGLTDSVERYQNQLNGTVKPVPKPAAGRATTKKPATRKGRSLAAVDVTVVQNFTSTPNAYAASRGVEHTLRSIL